MLLSQVQPGQEQTTTEIADATGEILELGNTEYIATIVGSLIIFVIAMILYFRARNNDKFPGLHIYFAVNSFLTIISGIVGLIAPDFYYGATVVVSLAEVASSICLAIYAKKTDHKGWCAFFIALLLLPIIMIFLLFAAIGVLFTALFAGSVPVV